MTATQTKSSEAPKGLRAKIRRVDGLLRPVYGNEEWRRRRPPLDQLIGTILSQNTSDTNSGRAFARLKERFPTWEDVYAADERKIEERIKPGGLGNQKARTIKRVLGAIKADRGRISLKFLERLPAAEGMDYLCSLDGVGRKTAACVLLFAFGMPAFPVDTHVHRVAKRLGWIPRSTTADKAGELLDAWVQDDIKYSLHLNLIAHGRSICHARAPECPICVLGHLCPRVGV